MAPSNTLPMHGNDKTMNLNSLVLTNIQSSPYFKVHLYELKTYHQVIDEIYYKVNHLEPWEKGSRKTAGQTGMCGGVRGVGTGGIVSSAFCLLYKLHTLKLTRKQLIGICNHTDSPYIRALGFMYIRFTQPSADLWEWFEPYLDDQEELDVKAGGGQMMTIGELVHHFLTKLDWYSTLFPRIAVPIQKQIEQGLREHKAKNWKNNVATEGNGEAAASFGRAAVRTAEVERADDRRDSRHRQDQATDSRANDKDARQDSRHRSRSRSPRTSHSREHRRSSREQHRPSHSRRSREHRRSHSNSRRRHSPSDRIRSSSRSRDHSRRDRHRDDRHRHERRRSASSENQKHVQYPADNHRSHHKHSGSEDEFKRDLRKEMDRIKREKGSGKTSE